MKNPLCPTEVDPLLWERLRRADPRDIAKRGSVRYDSGSYVVPFLGADIICRPERETLEVSDQRHSLDFDFRLAVLHYLLEAEERDPSGKWVSEKDLPSGEAFFRGPHVLAVKPLAELFGSSADLFRVTARSFGGTTMSMGDAAFRLPVFPRVPLLFILWEGDEEFDATINILFDETVALHLKALDTLWALTNVVCRSLRAAALTIAKGERR